MLRGLLASAALAVVLVISTEAAAAETLPPPVNRVSVAACDAKWLLAGHNVFKIRTYQPVAWKRTPKGCGWGKQALAATRKMKWELGYPPKWTNGKFGPNLYAFLTGKVKLPPLFAVRRAQRHPVLEVRQSYPLANRSAMCGWPGQGTHSFYARPSNWQSDYAVDMCAAEGTRILAPRAGQICGKLGPLYPGSRGRFGGIRFYLCTAEDGIFYFQHAKAVYVRLGQRVKAGQTIASVGVANVAHLHLSCDRSRCRSQSWWMSFLGLRGS